MTLLKQNVFKITKYCIRYQTKGLTIQFTSLYGFKVFAEKRTPFNQNYFKITTYLTDINKKSSEPASYKHKPKKVLPT